MRQRRIKFIWGGAEVIRGRWFFGLLGFYDREDGLAISVRGMLWWGLVGLVAAYVAGTVALFSLWQRNPYCLLNYSDAFFYPIRRAEVVAKKGQAFIAEGNELTKAGKWFDGARLLRYGLALYPSDLRARLTLAKFHAAVNQREQAMRILNEWMPKEFPGRSYVKGTFEIAGPGEDFGFIVALADRYLPALQGPDRAVERQWLSEHKFDALLHGKRFAEALAWAETNRASALAVEHRVLALLGLGRANDAIDFLEQSQKRGEADAATFRRLQVRVFREAGRLDDMERAIEEMRRSAPGDARQAVYGVVQRAMAGREDAARAALDDYLFRFGGTVANVQMAAEPLAEIGSHSLLQQCETAATQHGYPLYPLQVLRVQSHARRGEWQAGTAVLTAMKPPAGRTWTAAEQVWREWIGALLAAESGASEAAGKGLVEFLRGRPWQMRILRWSIEGLKSAGRLEMVREVVGVAEIAFPASGWVQEQKAAIATQLAAVSAPVVPASAAALPKAPAERVFFERLDELLRSAQWELAGQFMREVRAVRPPPDWVGKREADLLLAEVRIAQGRGETPAMITAAGLFLNGDAERSRKIIDLAREFHAADSKAAAKLLVQAVQRRVPEDGRARRLLEEWNAKPTPPR